MIAQRPRRQPRRLRRRRPNRWAAPIYIPQGLQREKQDVLFFRYEDYLKKQSLQDDLEPEHLRRKQGDHRDTKEIGPVSSSPNSSSAGATATAGDASIDVSVTSIRITKISIPLDPAGQYEVSGRITTLDRKFVTSFDEPVDHSGVVEKNLSLKVGIYRLDVVVKNQSDGSQATQTLSFEVK